MQVAPSPTPPAFTEHLLHTEANKLGAILPSWTSDE